MRHFLYIFGTPCENRGVSAWRERAGPAAPGPKPENVASAVYPIIDRWALANLARAQAEVTSLEKVCLTSCACLWGTTAMSGTRGVCVVSADQAPYRARSMRARGGDIFNGVTQNASCHITLGISQASDTSLLAFQSSANSRVTVTVPPHHRVGSRGRARG